MKLNVRAYLRDARSHLYTVTWPWPLALIHYSANQLERRHDLRERERERERGKRSGENKAFNRILFYRPHTTETTLANISRKQRQTPALYYNSLLFLYIYMYIYIYIYMYIYVLRACRYTGCAQRA